MLPYLKFPFFKKRLKNDEIQQILLQFTSINRQIIANLGRLITESNEDKFFEICDRIKILEAKGDELEKKIITLKYDTTYNHTMSYYQVITITNHLENIGDLARKTTSIYKKKKKTNSYITPKLRTQLMYLQDKISVACSLLLQNLNETDKINLAESIKTEKEINKIFKHTLKMLFKAVTKNKITGVSAIYYKEVIQIYELIGDNLIKANYMLKDKFEK